MSREAILRLVIGGTFLLVLFSLAVQDRPSTVERKAIADGLLDGTIGGLSLQEEGEASRMLAWLAEAASVQEPVQLNRPLKPGLLNVYTTTRPVQGLCRESNAEFVPALDAIFIDMNILKPLSRKEWANDIVDNWSVFGNLPLKPYFFFVVMHELGHKQLGHGRGGYLNRLNRLCGGRSTRPEDDADSFAVERLKEAFRLDMARGCSNIGKPAGSLFGEDLPFALAQSPAERFRADFVEMLGHACLANLFDAEKYSPFFGDDSHPMFVGRARKILQLLIAEPGIDPRFRANAIFVDDFLSRMESMGEFPHVTLEVDEGISEVNFDDDGLVIVGSEGRPYHVGTQFLIWRANRSNLVTLTRNMSLGPSQRVLYDEGLTSRNPVWACSGLSVVSLRGDLLYTVGTNGWSVADLSELHKLKDSALSLTSNGVDGFSGGSKRWRLFEHCRIPPQPGKGAVLVAHGDKSLLFYLAPEGRIVTRDVSELRANLDRLFGIDGSQFEVNSVCDDRVYLAVYSPLKADFRLLVGFALLDLPNLQLIRHVKPSLPDGVPGYPLGLYDGVVAVPQRNDERIIAVVNRSDQTTDRWTAMELSATALPAVIIEQPHLVEGVKRLHVPLPSLLKRPVLEGSQIIEAEEPWIMPSGVLKDLKVVRDDTIVVQYLDDSIYLLDLRARRSAVLFQAARGLSGVWLHIGRDGTIVIFSKSEGRCFVINPFARKGR